MCVLEDVIVSVTFLCGTMHCYEEVPSWSINVLLRQ